LREFKNNEKFEVEVEIGFALPVLSRGASYVGLII
jgi:hypothetical protein